MATKVLVIATGRKAAKPTLMDSRVARHLVSRGRFRYPEEAEVAAMEARSKKVIERAPEPPPVGLVRKGEEPPAGSAEPEAPSSESSEPPAEEQQQEEEAPSPDRPEPAADPGADEFDGDEVEVEVDDAEDGEEEPQPLSRRRAAAAPRRAARRRS